MVKQREEIETCIKEHNIDRRRFFESSKQSYAQIIRRIEDAFVDKSKNWNAKIHWANMGYYRPDIPCSVKVVESWNWINKLPQIIPEVETPVYVLFEDVKNYQPKYWLYEAYVNELVVVLNECSMWGDFYIVSKKYDWLISLNHHDVVSCLGKGATLDCLHE